LLLKSICAFCRAAGGEVGELVLKKSVQFATATPECVAFVPAGMGVASGGKGVKKARSEVEFAGDTAGAAATAAVPVGGTGGTDDSAPTMDDFLLHLSLANKPAPVACPNNTGTDFKGDITGHDATGVFEDQNIGSFDPAAAAITGAQWELVLGARGENISYLTYMHCSSLVERRVSLNENSWDSHVSFTPLFLAPSPTGEFLLVATDKNIDILLRTGTNIRTQVLCGHNCGDFGNPCVQWDRRGRYVYRTSHDDNSLFVYDVVTGKIASKVTGHKGVVRCVAVHPTDNRVLTGSYDKSIVLWQSSEGSTSK
jgi:hypothetical protein